MKSKPTKSTTNTISEENRIDNLLGLQGGIDKENINNLISVPCNIVERGLRKTLTGTLQISREDDQDLITEVVEKSASIKVALIGMNKASEMLNSLDLASKEKFIETHRIATKDLKPFVEKNGKKVRLSYNLFTEKLLMFSLQKLHEGKTNKICISNVELAKTFQMDRSNINKCIEVSAIALSKMQIREIKVKEGAEKRLGNYEKIKIANLIQSVTYENGETTIIFNDVLTELMQQQNFIMKYPTGTYALKKSFDLMVTLSEWGRINRSDEIKVTHGGIYEALTNLPRYENVKDRHYNRDIYQPIQEMLEELEKGGFIKILDQTDARTYINNNNYNFENWKKAGMKIKLLKNPNYGSIEENRKQAIVKAKKEATKKQQKSKT